VQGCKVLKGSIKKDRGKTLGNKQERGGGGGSPKEPTGKKERVAEGGDRGSIMIFSFQDEWVTSTRREKGTLSNVIVRDEGK